MDCNTDHLLTKTSKLLRYSLLASAILLLSACGTIDQVKERFSGDDKKLETTGTPSDATPEPVALNPRQQLLVSIQQSLDDLGYAPGRTDGIMDSQSEAAIQDFQLDNDMRINGRPSADLLENLERAIRLR